MHFESWLITGKLRIACSLKFNFSPVIASLSRCAAPFCVEETNLVITDETRRYCWRMIGVKKVLTLTLVRRVG